MVFKPFEHCSTIVYIEHTHAHLRPQKAMVYLDESDWFLVPSFSQSNFAKVLVFLVGATLEPFEWPPQNFVFVSNICIPANSHACGLKTSISRRLTLAGQFLTPDWKM